MSNATFGVISEATLRLEDLIPAFADALESLEQDNPTGIDGDTRAALIVHARFAQDHDMMDTEAASELLEELIEALQDHAPPFGYFGTLEGDGACFGFFLDHDAIRDAVQDGELPTISDTNRLDDRDMLDCDQVLHMNDHGNMTLYARDDTGQFREIWATV